MKAFLRDNIALVAGIALPLILAMAFMLVSWSQTWLVADPQYDAVFATHYYSHIHDFEIKDGDLKIRIKDKDKAQDRGYHYQDPKLYVFDHKLMATQQLNIDFGQTNARGYVNAPALQDLNARGHFIADKQAPDGYRFFHARNGGANFFLPFLFDMDRKDSVFLMKDTRRIVLLRDAGYHGAVHFIGWIRDEQ